VKTESPTVKTFTFRDKECALAQPGQFLMLWIPGIDEIPLSVLDAQEDNMVSVVVRKVGEATQALYEMRVGETIGVRGPFGNRFTIRETKALIVGGGTGTVPLAFLARRLLPATEKLIFVSGAKTKEELLFIEELERLCSKGNFVATTEDGSYGMKCLATTPLESLLGKEKIDMIYMCGPERMMRKIFDLAERHNIALEASLERLMRCAIGLCGSCTIGKYRVCKDGPVFTLQQLMEVKEEFGSSKRDFDGRKVPI
jgi:dihydroorotate dehydrogenase electron transfer subunit